VALPNFDAILFDAGGIFLLPDPTVLGPLLAYHGGDPSISAHRRAHYAGMAAKSAAGAMEKFWHDYNEAYVRSVGAGPFPRACARCGRCTLRACRSAW
jgi:hypothetical protein